MPFVQPDKIKYFQFDLFADAPIDHAIFTRQGGVSQGQWASLNMGLTVGDNPAHVQQNKQAAFDLMGRDMRGFGDSWLVHGTNVIVYDQPGLPNEDSEAYRADIVLTNHPDVTLFMRVADCVPLILYDPVKRAVGLVHAGWQGTVQKAAGAAVKAMERRYGSRPADLQVGIGPSIGPQKYEVGDNVIAAVQEAFEADAKDLLPKYGESTHFDLWAANELTLREAGVTQVERADLCTATQLDDWFSHRAEQGKTGRFGLLVGLGV